MLSTFLESFLGTRSEQKTQLALCSCLYYSFTTSSLCLQDYICFFSFILFYYFYLINRAFSLFLFNVNLIYFVCFCFSPFSLWLVNSGQHSLPSSKICFLASSVSVFQNLNCFSFSWFSSQEWSSDYCSLEGSTVGLCSADCLKDSFGTKELQPLTWRFRGLRKAHFKCFLPVGFSSFLLKNIRPYPRKQLAM